MEAKYMAFYPSYYKTIHLLPRELQLPAYELLIGYGLYGIVPEEELCHELQLLFFMAQPNIDRFRKHLEDGAKGGRPKKTGDKTPVKTPVLTKKEKEKEREKETFLSPGSEERKVPEVSASLSVRSDSFAENLPEETMKEEIRRIAGRYISSRKMEKWDYEVEPHIGECCPAEAFTEEQRMWLSSRYGVCFLDEARRKPEKTE